VVARPDDVLQAHGYESLAMQTRKHGATTGVAPTAWPHDVYHSEEIADVDEETRKLHRELDQVVLGKET